MCESHGHDDESTTQGPVGRVLTTDTSSATGRNVLSGGAGNDVFNATTSGHPADQIHLYGGGGNDTFNLDLRIAHSNFIRHGHHAFTGSGSDIVNFANISTLTSTIVGRLDDFSVNDKIMIGGHQINLYKPGEIGSISYHVVSFQGQQLSLIHI